MSAILNRASANYSRKWYEKWYGITRKITDFKYNWISQIQVTGVVPKMGSKLPKNQIFQIQYDHVPRSVVILILLTRAIFPDNIWSYNHHYDEICTLLKLKIRIFTYDNCISEQCNKSSILSQIIIRLQCIHNMLIVIRLTATRDVHW